MAKQGIWDAVGVTPNHRAVFLVQGNKQGLMAAHCLGLLGQWAVADKLLNDMREFHGHLFWAAPCLEHQSTRMMVPLTMDKHVTTFIWNLLFLIASWSMANYSGIDNCIARSAAWEVYLAIKQLLALWNICLMHSLGGHGQFHSPGIPRLCDGHHWHLASNVFVSPNYGHRLPFSTHMPLGSSGWTWTSVGFLPTSKWVCRSIYLLLIPVDPTLGVSGWWSHSWCMLWCLLWMSVYTLGCLLACVQELIPMLTSYMWLVGTEWLVKQHVQKTAGPG